MFSRLSSKFHHLFTIFIFYEQFEYIPGEGELLDFVVRVFVRVVDRLGFCVEPVTRNFFFACKPSRSRQEFCSPAVSRALHIFIPWFCWHFPLTVRYPESFYTIYIF